MERAFVLEFFFVLFSLFVSILTNWSSIHSQKLIKKEANEWDKMNFTNYNET